MHEAAKDRKQDHLSRWLDAGHALLRIRQINTRSLETAV
jgi:hypothetical protein